MNHTLKKIILVLSILSLVFIPSTLFSRKGGGHGHHKGHHVGHGKHHHGHHHGGHRLGHHGHHHHRHHHHKFHHRNFNLYQYYPYNIYPYQTFYTSLYPYGVYNYIYPSPSYLYGFQSSPDTISNYLYDRPGALQSYPSYLQNQNINLQLEVLKQAYQNPYYLRDYPQVQQTDSYAFPVNSPYR